MHACVCMCARMNACVCVHVCVRTCVRVCVRGCAVGITFFALKTFILFTLINLDHFLYKLTEYIALD